MPTEDQDVMDAMEKKMNAYDDDQPAKDQFAKGEEDNKLDGDLKAKMAKLKGMKKMKKGKGRRKMGMPKTKLRKQGMNLRRAGFKAGVMPGGM